MLFWTDDKPAEVIVVTQEQQFQIAAEAEAIKQIKLADREAQKAASQQAREQMLATFQKPNSELNVEQKIQKYMHKLIVKTEESPILIIPVAFSLIFMVCVGLFLFKRVMYPESHR